MPGKTIRQVLSDMALSQFQDKLVSDPGTVSADDRPEEVKVIENKLRAHIQEHGVLSGVEGIFGDGEGCSAYVEREELTNNGWLTWFYGCSYPYKGRIRGDFTDSAATMKRVAMEGVRLVSKLPFLLLFYKTLIKSLLSIYAADFEKYHYLEHDPEKSLYQLKDFSGGKREILRVLLKLARNEDEKRLTICFTMLLEADNAYWQRLQDAMTAADPCFISILDVLIDRERQSVAEKFRLVRRMLRLLQLIPSFREFEDGFFTELDYSKLRVDEADWYFMLNRRCYDYGGVPFETRYAEYQRINRRKGHIILGI